MISIDLKKKNLIQAPRKLEEKKNNKKSAISHTNKNIDWRLSEKKKNLIRGSLKKKFVRENPDHAPRHRQMINGRPLITDYDDDGDVNNTFTCSG